MPDTRDPQAVIAAAEQAALAGDYAAAERLLRDAALLQEASLGPHHPELANTLNNLGVVYEVTEKPDEAERCFRRASTIAGRSIAFGSADVARAGASTGIPRAAQKSSRFFRLVATNG